MICVFASNMVMLLIYRTHGIYLGVATDLQKWFDSNHTTTKIVNCTSVSLAIIIKLILRQNFQDAINVSVTGVKKKKEKERSPITNLVHFMVSLTPEEKKKSYSRNMLLILIIHGSELRVYHTKQGT